MTAILGMAALVVDAGSWYQKHRKVQAAADAAATAAASYLPSDTSGSILAATTYVNKNIAGATTTAATPYGGDTRKVEVKVSASAPTFFARIFGVNSVTVEARAVAMREDGGGRWAVFSHSSGCSTQGITSPGSSNTINGNVRSNGRLSVPGSDNRWGETTFGGPNNCNSSLSGSNNTFAGDPAPTRDPGLYDWPQFWFGGGAPPADVCTFSASKFSWSGGDTVIPDGTYCATDEISISNQGSSCTCTFIAPKVSLSASNLNFTPYHEDLLIYHYSSGADFNISGSGSSLTGTIFVPYRRLGISGSNGDVYNLFLEAKTISISGSGWTMNGSGPTTSYSGTRLTE